MRFACLADGSSVSSYVPLATWPFNLLSWSARRPNLSDAHPFISFIPALPLLHARLLLVALFFFFSLPLSFSRTFSDTIPRRAKVLRLFRPVTGDECRLSYPWTVSIGRNINKVIEGEWHGRGKYIGCCARTYLCILLIDDKSIRRWFRLLSYYVACNDKRARLCFHNFRINNKKRAILMNEIIRYFFLFYHPLSFTYIYIYFFFKYIL